MRVVLLAIIGLLFVSTALAQLFIPPFPPPVTSSLPIVQAARKDIFILNGGSVAILNGITQ